MTDRIRSQGRSGRRRVAASVLMVLLFAVLALGLAPLAAATSVPPAAAAAAAVAPAGLAGFDWRGQIAAAASDRGTMVQFGKDATIDAGQQADAVVALDGDVTVNGTVQVAVAVGGDVTVNGTVEKTCVSVGGNVKLGPTAVVGSGLSAKDDTAVVTVGGHLIKDPGAQVTGSTTDVQGTRFTNAFKWSIWDPIAHPFHAGSILGWFIQTIVIAVLAIIAVAVAPRQIQAISRTLRRRALASLGWGALTAIIIVPVSLILLTITIIGLLIVVPGVFIALPLTALFSFLCLCAFVGIQVLGGSEKYRGNLILAALIGVAVVNVVRLIPFVGGFIVAVASLMALGAIVLAIGDWQRGRRETRRLERAAAAGTPPAPGAPPAGGSPYVTPPLPPAPAVVPIPPAGVYPEPGAGATAVVPAAAVDAATVVPAEQASAPAAAEPGPVTTPETPNAATATNEAAGSAAGPADAATAPVTAKPPVPEGAATSDPAASAPAESAEVTPAEATQITPAEATEVTPAEATEVTPAEAPPAPPAEPAAAPPESGDGDSTPPDRG